MADDPRIKADPDDPGRLEFSFDVPIVELCTPESLAKRLGEKCGMQLREPAFVGVEGESYLAGYVAVAMKVSDAVKAVNFTGEPPPVFLLPEGKRE